MDGAGKFVKGDAVAALVIVALNLLGGVAVGATYFGLPPLDALNTFALLSIGNALVTTLPAFLISIAMGMMVTRVAGEGALGTDLAAQLFSRPEVLRSAGGLLLALAFVPALPRPVFVCLAACAFALAQNAARSRNARAADGRAASERAKRLAMRRPELALGLVGVDAVSIDVGAEIAQLLAPPLSDALLDRVGEVRRALAGEIGIVLPGVRLRDDLSREPQTYAIRIRDRVAGAGRLELDRVCAVADERVLLALDSRLEREPVYGLPAAWIAPSQRDRAVEAGALVFDPISIVGSHLAEIARANAADLLGRQEVQTLLEHLRSRYPSLVKDVGTDALPLGALHRAIQLLLRERVWPRDPVVMLEAMLETGSCDPRALAEAARRAAVCDQLRRRKLERFEPLVLDADLDGAGDDLDPALALAMRDRIAAFAGEAGRERAAVVCGAAMRPVLAELLHRSGVDVDVFAYHELPPELRLRPAAVLNRAACLT
jgi:flagellar biosynthesis protein FlhA